MYDKVIRKIEAYHKQVGIGTVAQDKDFYFWELTKRLQQLNWLYKRILKGMARIRFPLPLGNLLKKPLRIVMPQSLFQLEIYTEAFYLFAFRIVEILHEKKIPGIKKFKCPGIRLVRNEMIVHPSHDVLNFSFGFSSRLGPFLKNARIDGRKKQKGTTTDQDKGLFANAKELENRLDSKFGALITVN